MLKNGVDYREKFASTPQVDSLKILLSLVAHYDWDLELNDIVGFFLEALLEKGEKIFMEQIPGHDDALEEFCNSLEIFMACHKVLIMPNSF